MTPQFKVEDAPPRLVIDLPGSTIAAPQTLSYPDALVTAVSAEQANATTTRVTLTLARPVGQNWAQRVTANSLVLIFDRNPVQE
ncbi:hypothetical protein D3C78_1753690 [compost metagenome]